MSLKYKTENGTIYDLEGSSPSKTFDPESEEAMSGIAIAQQLPFRLGIDEEGNYGYYKDGADTVTPFKEGGEEETWLRPLEWPNLDLLPVDDQVIYFTLNNTTRNILFAVQLNTKNYTVDTGNIVDGEFQVIKTYTSNNISWFPDTEYFSDIEIDYPVIRITSPDNITSFKFQNPYDPATGMQITTRFFVSIVEAYYSLPYITAINYLSAYQTEHIKLINLQEINSFYQAFQDAKNLKLIEFENCDTSKVTTYKQMCWACYSLKDTSFLKDLDCSSCTTIQSMFYGAGSLISVDLTLLKNTEKITDISKIFYTANSLQELKIDGKMFPALNLADSAFSAMGTMQSLDLSSFDLEGVSHATLLGVIKAFNLKLPKNYTQSFNLTGYVVSREYLLSIMEQLGTITDGHTATFTIGTTNLRLLTDADKAIATQKGWTLA